MSSRPAGSQVEAHGRAAAISCHRSGDASSDPDADTAMGGEPGATPLRAVPAPMLHGLAAKWRAAQSEGELWPKNDCRPVPPNSTCQRDKSNAINGGSTACWRLYNSS